MRSICYIVVSILSLAFAGSASAGSWRNNSCRANPSAVMGTITGLEFSSTNDSFGDRVYVLFSTSTGNSDYFYFRLSDFGGDSVRFNRLYSGLLSIQASGQSVTDIIISDCNSNIFTGYSLGKFF